MHSRALTAAVLALMIATSSFATDSFEPNDDPSQAYELSNGVEIESWLSVDGDLDWYVFVTPDLGALYVRLRSLPADYDLELWWYNPGTTLLELIVRSESSGTADEIISGTLTETGAYFLLVYADEGIYDPDDSYLLEACWPPTQGPVVEVTAPDGGETWAAGSSQTITYSATDPDTPADSLVIQLDYSVDSGSSWTLIDSALANTGTYAWTVPRLATSHARVRVEANDGEHSTVDISDADFTIAGTTYIVRADGSGDFATIQQAIDGAEGGDTIQLASGTYTGYRNRDLDFGGKLLILCSETGTPSTCVINCEGSLSLPRRGFDFHSGESPLAVITGLTVTGGDSRGWWPGSEGGAVRCTGGSSPSFTNCAFTSNDAADGGALYCADSSAPALSGCTFTGNTAGGGDGGAVLCVDYAAPAFTGCAFTSNTAATGGAVCCDSSASPAFTTCTLESNTATSSGGALACDNGSSPSLTTCTFDSNTAAYNGGGLVCRLGCAPELTGCTFYGNAAGNGGGISAWFTALPVLGTTIIASSTTGEALHCGSGGSATLSCCDLWGNAGGDWVGGIAAQAGQNDNLSADPLFCSPASGNFNLDTTSPCAPENNPACGLIGACATGCTVNTGANVLLVPDTLTVSTASATGVQVINYTGGGSGVVFGFEIDVEWDHTVAAATFTTADTGPFAAPLIFQSVVIGDGHQRIFASLPAGQPGTTGDDPFFKGFFGALSGSDTSTVDLTLRDFRDSQNTPLTGFTEDDGLLIVDWGPLITDVAIQNTDLATNDYIKNGDGALVTASIVASGATISTINANLTGLGGGAAATPATYTASVAWWSLPSVVTDPADGNVVVTVAAWDAAMNYGVPDADTIIADNTVPTALLGLSAEPGHEQIDLAWNDASGNDANYEGVMLRSARWDAYPTYSTAAPAYPASYTTGNLAYSGTGTTATYSFATSSRGVYYLAGFVYDVVGHYSPTGSTARATNYWLGDVVPGGAWNGLVNTADISALGAQFYQVPLTNGEVDVAPTDDGSRTGIPEPDGAADFDDAMIFAMNYGIVSDRGRPARRPLGDADVGLSLSIQEDADELCAGILLHDPAGLVQGARWRIVFDEAALELLDAQEGRLLDLGEGFLMRRGPEMAVVALGAGATFGQSGELARLTFRRRGDAPIDLALADRAARDTHNRDLLGEPSEIADEARLPRAVFLAPNLPNPVCGDTRFLFGLPEAGPVRLAIFDITGRRVRLLASGEHPAGEHHVIWDRRDAGGRPVPSSVYFCRLEAGGRQLTRKFVITR